MKRIEELRDLSREHHTALLLAKRCIRFQERGGEERSGFWDGIKRYFSEHLEPHFRIEENLIVPGLKKLGEDRLCKKLLSDHAGLRKTMKIRRPSAADINDFGSRLKNHIRFEETELFEFVQNNFSRKQLARIHQAADIPQHGARKAPPPGGRAGHKARVLRLQLKRVYAPPSEDDGIHLLVDRLWPRGLDKRRAQLDGWVREIAPSDALRRWFRHDPARWEEFQQHYFTELDNAPDACRAVLAQARTGPVTLLYGARDPDHNNAVALKHYLERPRQHRDRKNRKDKKK